MNGTVKSADCGTAKALGLTREGTESGVDVSIRQGEHVGIVSWLLMRLIICTVLIGWRNSVVRDGVTMFAMPMPVTHLWLAERFSRLEKTQ